jgi:ATP-dependent Clp protease ATP-binding subunit ClpA
MSALNMKSLLGKLNDVCIQSLTAAASLCVARTNYEVEIEHWLFKLIENTGSDLGVFLRHFDVDISRVNRDLTRALDQVKTGNPRSAPQFSPLIMDLIRHNQSPVFASLAGVGDREALVAFDSGFRAGTAKSLAGSAAKSFQRSCHSWSRSGYGI